jgi:recombination protein RecA
MASDPIAEIQKKYGKSAFYKMSDQDNVLTKVEGIPSGCLSLDMAIGLPGIPRGRIIEFYGLESSGKSTMCLKTISEAQKIGLRCAYIDAEQAFDPKWAIKQGVDVKELYISQPDYGEEALDIVEICSKSGQYPLIIIDSVAALTPKKIIDGEMGDQHMALQARMMSQAMQKLAGLCNKSKTTLVFINQLRQKIGVMFGEKRTTPGGLALKFYSSVRVEFWKGSKIKEKSKSDDTNDKGEIIGYEGGFKVIKNKVGEPYKAGGFDFYNGKGIDIEKEACDLGLKFGVFEADKEGNFYFGDEMIGENEKKILSRFDKDPELVQKVRAAILKSAAEKPEPIQKTNGVQPEVESPSEKEEDQADEKISKAEKRRLRKLERKKKKEAVAA